MTRHEPSHEYGIPGHTSCLLCAHRRAGRIARETYREIQVQRRNEGWAEALNVGAADRHECCNYGRVFITRANFQRSKT